MIIGFKDRETERLWNRRTSRRLPRDIQRRALKRLEILNAAKRLENLATSPSYHLEMLHGDRAGQHSIRINDQWRVCFVWRDGNAAEVEILDYH